MKKRLFGVLAACLVAGLIMADGSSPSGYAGRVTKSLTTNLVAKLGFTGTVQVNSITVVYGQPYTGTLVVAPHIAGVQYPRNQVQLGTNTAVVLTFMGLWVSPTDSLLISNSVSAASTVIIDCTYQ